MLALVTIVRYKAEMESKKKKVGLFLPTALADAFDDISKRVGKKQKWLVVGAALVRLLEAPETEQNELIRDVKIADLPGGSFEGLIARARSKGATTGPRFHGLVAEADPDTSPAIHPPAPALLAANRPTRSHAPAETSAGTRKPRPAPRPASDRKRG